MKNKPSGFFAVCQCGETVGAMDFDRTDRKEASRILGEWLINGCTVTPVFEGCWSKSITSCKCINNEDIG